jgi:hypothetical protein
MDDGEVQRRRDVSGVGRDRPRWWLACVHTAAVAGLLCGLVLWGWQSVLGLVVSFLVIASLAVVAVWGGDESHDLRQTATVSAYLTLGLTAAAGLVAATGGLGLLLIVVLAITSPHLDLWRRVREWVGPSRTTPYGPAAAWPPHDAATEPGPAPAPAAPAVEDLTTLDDAALVLAWRRSFVQLEAARSELDRLTVVARRQQLLDELERRCPEGVARWLASGARAQGNPQPYLGERRQPPPP